MKLKECEVEMVKIEVLGTGCTKCKSLTKNVEKAVQELGIKAEIVKVDNINEIMNRGVMMTPALTSMASPRWLEESPQ